jgi:hypothetical protein
MDMCPEHLTHGMGTWLFQASSRVKISDAEGLLITFRFGVVVSRDMRMLDDLRAGRQDGDFFWEGVHDGWAVQVVQP